MLDTNAIAVWTGAVVVCRTGSNGHDRVHRVVGVVPPDDAEHHVASPPGLLKTSTTVVKPPAVIEKGVRVIGVGASVTAGASSEAYVTV